MIPLGNEAVRKLNWVWGHGDLTSGAYVGTCILFALAVVRSLALVIHVVRPRGLGVPGTARPPDPRFSEDYPKLPAADKLLFYKHILQHGDPHSYFTSVSNASPDLLLRNLTDQTFELARICDEKTDLLGGGQNSSSSCSLRVGLEHRSGHLDRALEISSSLTLRSALLLANPAQPA